MTAIGIIGSAGRMGQALAAVVPDLGATLAGGIDAGGDPAVLALDADVLVDFSTPAALERTLAAARQARTPILIGTTGLAPTHRAQSSTISEIASAVNAMDHSTQQNAAMVEQTSAAARNLAGEVATLSRQSARFNVGSTSPTSMPKPVAIAARARPSGKISQPPLAARTPTAANADWASF